MKNSATKIRHLGATVNKDVSFSCLGEIVDVSETGKILVDFKGNKRGPQEARIVLSPQILNEVDEKPLVGRSVLLIFEDDGLVLPVIVGMVHERIFHRNERNNEDFGVSIENPFQVSIDGATLLLEAKKEVVLRCGKSSITLSKNGKIVVKGTELVSRSSGANKIKGSTISIN